MKIVQYYKENKTNYGTGSALKKVFQYGIKKLLGVDKYEVQLSRQKEELDTLFYFLNECVDITSIKPSSDDLRILQECDTLFLSIFDKVCMANNLQYWIGGGTLLGAVRHEGFIPWDDDTDVCMLREDFERALNLLPKKMARLGFDVQFDEKYPLATMGLGYKHYKTGIWIDIFPIDTYKLDSECNNIDILKKKIDNYHKQWTKMKKNNVPCEDIINEKKKILPGLCDYKSSDIAFENVEFFHRHVFYDKNDLLPIRRMKFGSTELNGPNNPDAILNTIYGNNYMGFPHVGVEHHGNSDGKISEWAKKSGIDMNEVKRELIHILNSI